MNSVLYWNSVLLEASRRDFTKGYVNNQQPGPIRTSRAMAIVHLAIHDAVAFHDQPAAAYLNKKNVMHSVPNLTGAVDDIIAGAAVTALKELYPAYTAFFDDAVGKVNNSAFNGGAKVAMAILEHRANDGSAVGITGPQPAMPDYGEHRADPYAPNQPQLGPVWGNVARFTGDDHQPLAPLPGQDDGEQQLSRRRRLLRRFRGSPRHGSVPRRSRTATQERIGVYWGYDGANNLGVPPRLYNQLARAVLAQRSPMLNVTKTAELFASINVAMADAGIDAWHWKYVYKLWRPVVGIRNQAAPDGDPFWAPLGAPQTNAGRGTLTPAFPAYPSGHATFGAAVMQALRLGLNTVSSPITIQDVLAVEDGNVGARSQGDVHLRVRRTRRNCRRS